MASTSKPECPPLDGSLLFPDIIEFHMQRNASWPMYIFPDPQHTGALTSISFLEFGRAAHRVAHAFRPARTGMDGQVTAILVQTDTLLYTTLIAGLIIAGIIVSPIPSVSVTVSIPLRAAISYFHSHSTTGHSGFASPNQLSSHSLHPSKSHRSP